jgi:hypothetical protein
MVVGTMLDPQRFPFIFKLSERPPYIRMLA